MASLISSLYFWSSMDQITFQRKEVFYYKSGTRIDQKRHILFKNFFRELRLLIVMS